MNGMLIASTIQIVPYKIYGLTMYAVEGLSMNSYEDFQLIQLKWFYNSDLAVKYVERHMQFYNIVQDRKINQRLGN